MDDGVIIYIGADEGVLPAGVTASAVRVNEDVENAVKEPHRQMKKAKLSHPSWLYDRY